MKPHNPLFKQLLLKARDTVYHTHLGAHLSKTFGEGVEFSELREYQIGDDIRHINWNMTAKLQQPYVKVLHTHKALLVNVVTLLDGSLFFGTDNLKQTLLCDVVAHLGYATYHNGDLFSGFGFTQNTPYFTSPTKEIASIEHFVKQLYATKLLYTHIPYNETIQRLSTLLSQPSLLIIIGDFLEEVDLAPLSLKHDVVAIIVRHAMEEKLQTFGEVSLQSPLNPTQKQNSYLHQKSMRTYQKRVQAHDAKLTAHFQKHGIRFTKITTDDMLIIKLIKMFEG
jgi:uncharacterized protein (DUF58 family)